MSKKEAMEQLEPDVFVFQTGEEESRPEVGLKQQQQGEGRRSSLGNFKIQEALKVHLRRNSYKPHKLNPNFFKKEDNKENDVHYEEKKDQIPSDIKQHTELCESIFLAEQSGFDIDFGTPSKVEKVPLSNKNLDNQQAVSVIQHEDKDNTQNHADVGNLEDLQSPMFFQETHTPMYGHFQQKTEISEDIHKRYDQEHDQPEIMGLQVDRQNGKRVVQITNKDFFIINPIPPGIILNCKMRRSRDFLNFITPEYDFFLDCGLRHIVSAQKKILSSKQAFLISTELGTYYRDTIVGSLRTNVVRNQFVLASNENGKNSKYQYIYAGINYGKLNKDNKLQRSMQVTLPVSQNIKVKSHNLRNFTFNDIQNKHKMILFRKENNIQKSQKNFELIDQDDDYVYLRLTKDTQNVYNIAIQHPLTPLQAFGIILTRFDAQLK